MSFASRRTRTGAQIDCTARTRVLPVPAADAIMDENGHVRPCAMRSTHNPSNLPCYFHGRDSWSGQRKHDTLRIQRVHGLVDRLVESFSISKGVMREMMRLEVRQTT